MTAHLHHHHDPVLSIVSVVIAIFASYIALDLANSISVAQGRARLAWLFGGSLAMGVGIWSMHFVGMLAFRMPGVQIAYDVPLLILSILVAIAASALSLFIVSRERVTSRAFAAGSFAMGTAIVGMHYIGIAGMRLSARYIWNYDLVAASVGIAYVASFVALWLSFRLRGDMSKRGFISRTLGGVVMGIAISGMHYTAMAAMIFMPGPPLLLESQQLLATDGLATAVICTSLLIMGIALTGSIVDRALARREAMTAQITRILESVTDGFFSVDLAWNLAYANQLAQQTLLSLSGTASDRVKGRNLWELVPALRGTRFESESQATMRNGASAHIEEYVKPLKAWFDMRIYPSSDGISVYFRDVSDQKRAQEAIEQARKAAEAATRVKSQFIANVSHEIRTPLGVILGFAELAADDSLPQQERGTYIDGIIRNAKELSKLIGDVLDLSRVEAERLDVEVGRFKLRELLAEVADTLRLRALEREVQLVVAVSDDVPAVVATDRVRVRQILVNLIGNAVKFTEKGRVEIKAFRRPDGNNQKQLNLVFEVSDTGIGLSEEQSQALFEPFSQIDSSMTRKYGGTGLGLALSKRLAHALGGDLWLEKSAPGHGSTFVFSVKDQSSDEIRAPLPIDPLRPAETVPHDANTLNGISLLLVDDSPDNRLVVCRHLTRAGAKTETASNGREGVQAALSGDYHVVLMDIQMPEMDGFEATAELRRRGYTKPILALTAHAMKEEREKALKAGFDGYLTKPIDRARLVATLQTLTADVSH